MEGRRIAARAAAVSAAAIAGFAGFAVASSLDTAPAATAAEAPYAGRIGLNSHLVWISQAEAQPQLERARAGGVQWVREEFPWRIVEPEKGTFAWRNTDALMAAAAASGIQVLGILSYSAKWASSDPSGAGDDKYPPRDPGEYANYALEVVKRYGPGGSFWSQHPELPARPLTAVEIWNEPFGHWFWKPNPDPSGYARLVRAAATAIKQHDSSVRVLISGDVLQTRTDGSIRNWQREVLAADGGLSSLFDTYSVHPYPYPRNLGPSDERSDARWDYRRVELTHEADSTKPIWITEIGWSTASGVSDAVSEATQATFVRGAVERALGRWGAYVERIFPYQWDRDRGATSDREGYFGLRRADDSAKPAWNELVALLAASTASSTTSTTASTASGTTPTTATTTTTTTTNTTTTATATTATTTNNGNHKGQEKPRPRGASSADPIELRFVHVMHTAGPRRLPRWFWKWAAWKRGSRAVRPRVPAPLPRWAWRRLASLTSDSYSVVLRGHVRGEPRWIERATGLPLRVVVLVHNGRDWQPLRAGLVRPSGRFRMVVRLRAGSPSLVRVALTSDPAASSRIVQISRRR